MPANWEPVIRHSRALRALPALLLIGAGPSYHYTLDPSRSDISAKVAFFGLASKTARFPKANGAITLDPSSPETLDLQVTIDARSITAPDALTLNRLKGPDFFDVARHPTIVFTGRTMHLRSPLEADVAGQLSTRGVTRPARLRVRFASPPSLTDGRSPVSLSGTMTIDRRAFGMTAYPVIVGRSVTISLQTTMVPR